MENPIPNGLYEKVIQKISSEQLKRNRKRVIFWIFSTCASLTGCVFFVTQLYTDITSSGTYEYMSLATQDTEIVIEYWKEFLLLIGESFPVTKLILFLTTLFMFLASARGVLKYMPTLKKYKKIYA